MKKNLKVYRMEMGMFDFAVRLVVGDYHEAVKYCGRFFNERDFVEYDASINGGYVPRGKCFFKSGYVPVLWIPRVPKTPREHATFAHECTHAVFHLFEWASLPVSRDTEEAFCHALAHLINGFSGKMK